MRSVIGSKLAPPAERRARAEVEQVAGRRDAWLRWSMTFGALVPVLAVRSPALGALAGLMAMVALRAAWWTNRRLTVSR